MKITVSAITFEPDIVEISFVEVCCMLFLVDSRMKDVICVLTYHVPLWHHMTYDVFCV